MIRQYDKVLIPNETGIPEESVFKIMDALKHPPTELNNVICCTIEEIRELCRTIVSEWVEIKPAGSMDAQIDNDTNFYLQSKGINIDQDGR